MTGPVFGDVVGPARVRLEAAARFDGGLREDSAAAAVCAVRRITGTLSRYLADIVPYHTAETMTSPGLDARTRAVVDAREALRMAAAGLRTRDVGADDAGGGAPEPLVAHLAAAAVSLAAGRDLLRTHFGTDSRGGRTERSDWSAVITSGPVTWALLREVARWARQIALANAKLSLATPVDAPVEAAALGDAFPWFLAVSRGLTSAQSDDPARVADTELLDAIPVNIVPARQPAQEGEPMAGLAEGVAASAARLRVIAWSMAERAVSSPAMTADSWRWAATASAVIWHTGDSALRAMAGHPGLGSGLPDVGPQLRAAADSAASAWESWRQVAAGWTGLTTETKGLTAPAIADTGDLILRLGRIAFGDLGWGPARARSRRLADPVVLAPDGAQLVSVVSAVHRAVDAAARVGAADLRGVEMAVRASRLYVRTRSLPEGYDVPYRFAHAISVDDLLDSYGVAVEAGWRAVGDLHALAVALRAPSRVLAAARAATRPAVGGVLGREQGRAAKAVISAVSGRGPAAGVPPGPVEQSVLRLRTADPFLLLRAKTIDAAARELIGEAQEAARRQRGSGALKRADTSASENASPEIASKSFPHAAGTSMSGPKPHLSARRVTVSVQPKPVAPSTCVNVQHAPYS
jgi:hypothetical protein